MLPSLRRHPRKGLPSIRPSALLLSFLCLIFVSGLAGAAFGAARDAGTIFVLQPDAARNRLVDRTGAFDPAVSGGTVVPCDGFGACLRFGGGDRNAITIKDGGKLDLSGGFTLEAWIYLEGENAADDGGTFATKAGWFWFSLRDSKLNDDGILFPKELFATTTPSQYREYPVDNEGYGGVLPLPVQRWVHLAVTYDEKLKVVRSFIDGALDRTRYLSRTGAAPILSDPAKPLQLLAGMKHCGLAEARLSRGAASNGATPTRELPSASLCDSCSNRVMM